MNILHTENAGSMKRTINCWSAEEGLGNSLELMDRATFKDSSIDLNEHVTVVTKLIKKHVARVYLPKPSGSSHSEVLDGPGDS